MREQCVRGIEDRFTCTICKRDADVRPDFNWNKVPVNVMGPSLAGGVAKYEEIGGCHNPKGIVADYWDFDVEPHNRNQS